MDVPGNRRLGECNVNHADRECRIVIACEALEYELRRCAESVGGGYDFRFLPQALHRTPGLLGESLREAIDSVSGERTILVGYGLCGNGIEGISARRHRLVFMRGHGCIAFLLGSRRRYAGYLEKTPGTYWYTHGWIASGFAPGEETFARLFREYTEKYGAGNARYLMAMEREALGRYTTAVYVDSGGEGAAGEREYAARCARWFGWEYDEVAGDSRLMRDFLAGKWNEDDFLVVSPGEIVAATHDERIFAARKDDGTE